LGVHDHKKSDQNRHNANQREDTLLIRLFVLILQALDRDLINFFGFQFYLRLKYLLIKQIILPDSVEFLEYQICHRRIHYRTQSHSIAQYQTGYNA